MKRIETTKKGINNKTNDERRDLFSGVGNSIGSQLSHRLRIGGKLNNSVVPGEPSGSNITKSTAFAAQDNIDVNNITINDGRTNNLAEQRKGNADDNDVKNVLTRPGETAGKLLSQRVLVTDSDKLINPIGEGTQATDPIVDTRNGLTILPAIRGLRDVLNFTEDTLLNDFAAGVGVELKDYPKPSIRLMNILGEGNHTPPNLILIEEFPNIILSDLGFSREDIIEDITNQLYLSLGLDKPFLLSSPHTVRGLSGRLSNEGISFEEVSDQILWLRDNNGIPPMDANRLISSLETGLTLPRKKDGRFSDFPVIDNGFQTSIINFSQNQYAERLIPLSQFTQTFIASLPNGYNIAPLDSKFIRSVYTYFEPVYSLNNRVLEEYPDFMQRITRLVVDGLCQSAVVVQRDESFISSIRSEGSVPADSTTVLGTISRMMKYSNVSRGLTGMILSCTMNASVYFTPDNGNIVNAGTFIAAMIFMIYYPDIVDDMHRNSRNLPAIRVIAAYLLNYPIETVYNMTLQDLEALPGLHWLRRLRTRRRNPHIISSISNSFGESSASRCAAPFLADDHGLLPRDNAEFASHVQRLRSDRAGMLLKRVLNQVDFNVSDMVVNSFRLVTEIAAMFPPAWRQIPFTFEVSASDVLSALSLGSIESMPDRMTLTAELYSFNRMIADTLQALSYLKPIYSGPLFDRSLTPQERLDAVIEIIERTTSDEIFSRFKVIMDFIGVDTVSAQLKFLTDEIRPAIANDSTPQFRILQSLRSSVSANLSKFGVTEYIVVLPSHATGTPIVGTVRGFFFDVLPELDILTPGQLKTLIPERIESILNTGFIVRQWRRVKFEVSSNKGDRPDLQINYTENSVGGHELSVEVTRFPIIVGQMESPEDQVLRLLSHRWTAFVVNPNLVHDFMNFHSIQNMQYVNSSTTIVKPSLTIIKTGVNT